uniref:Transposase MuDR plant domain-containing protein n=1 Tax=Brassica oleracea var. oleracea TaxID=109376 RepID=A0A0D2ZTX9_BRAOL
MLKNSDIWTVRSYIKQHTCSVVTRTLPDREAGDEDGTENGATGGVLTFHRDIEMHEMHGNFTERDEHVLEDTEVRPRVVYQPRDDGTGLVLGQEFRTKEEAKVHIQTASHQKCFEFDITKSDTTRFVVKCRGAKDGCKWFVRVEKLKNTDLWTVRSYIKQHTCSVITTRTLPDKRKGTSQIVAFVLAQDYPGTFDTPVPKVLIDLVHRRIGVHVLYTSAWRAKREAANEVRGSPEERFTLLYCYMHMLEQTNIGTRTRVVVDEANKLKYLFFALWELA